MKPPPDTGIFKAGPPPGTGTLPKKASYLNLANLQKMCVLRSRTSPKFAKCKEWTVSDWLVALMGEVGELANFVKKERRDVGNFQEDYEKELADIQMYLVMLAEVMKVDLAAVTVAKFNEVSNRPDAFGVPTSTVRLDEEVDPNTEYRVGQLQRANDWLKQKNTELQTAWNQLAAGYDRLDVQAGVGQQALSEATAELEKAKAEAKSFAEALQTEQKALTRALQASQMAYQRFCHERNWAVTTVNPTSAVEWLHSRLSNPDSAFFMPLRGTDAHANINKIRSLLTEMESKP